MSEKRRYCYAKCRDPWFNECADCWQSGGNPALASTEVLEAQDGTEKEGFEPSLSAKVHDDRD